MTRRCSVMRMPVAAQRASIPVAVSTGLDLNTVISGYRQGWSSSPEVRFRHLPLSRRLPIITRSAIAQMSGQVAPHQERIQGFAAALPVIALAAANDAKSGPLVEPPCRLVSFLHHQKNRPNPPTGQVAQMGQQQGIG